MAASSPSRLLPAVDPEREKQYSLEKQFHVKNIPIDFDDWAVMKCFRKYGLVDNVRLPAVPQPNGKFRYGFVSMMTYEGADSVRAALVHGQLAADENVMLKIENVTSQSFRGLNDKENANAAGRGRFTRNAQRPPFANRNARGSTAATQQAAPTACGILSKPKFATQLAWGRLPTAEGIDVMVVDYPHVHADAFRFSVMMKEWKSDERWAQMEEGMKRWTSENAVDTTVVEKLEIAIIRRAGKLHRAKLLPQNRESGDGPRRAFLVDEGITVDVVPHETWPMPEEIAVVPTKLIHCSIAGLIPKPNAEVNYPSVLSLLHTVCDRATLRLHLVGYEKDVSVVNAFSVFTHSNGRVEVGDIGKGLGTKEYFEFDDTLCAPREYTKEQLMKIREENKEQPLPACLRSPAFTSIVSPSLVVAGLKALTVN